MLIREMFEKEIDRDIQGVIIVGQSEAENVAQELDEYVVTRFPVSLEVVNRTS